MMQGSFTPQATPTPSGESKAETHTLPLKTLFEQLQSSEQGLTGEEARGRLDTYGPNDTTGIKRSSGLVQFLRLFLNPLVMILLLASLVSIILGDRVNASIIIAIVLLSNILNFVQTYNSQHAVEKLRAAVAPTATVLRDGTWSETPRHTLVPGDMIRLAAGDLVPADARLVQATDLHVQQAALTGESLPVEKHADDLDAPTESFAEVHNSVFLGTSVVSGTATALVTATGRNTTFGDIAARLCTPGQPSARDRIRARHQGLWHADHADGFLPGALYLPGWHPWSSSTFRDGALRHLACSGADARVPAHDHDGDAGTGRARTRRPPQPSVLLGQFA